MLWAFLTSTGDSAALMLRATISGAGLAVCSGVYAFYARRLVKRRIYEPLLRFQESLEDIAEGFILDEMPEEVFREAEEGIAQSFRQVVAINKMMLRTVDNLEKGFEEERLAKLKQVELTNAYEKFVPHEFIGFLNKESITQVRLGDHVQLRMTVLFSDMRSFTTLSERVTPEESFRFLNRYLMAMEPVVQKHGGFIDKYIGDAIMALFHQGADQAVRSAISMMAELARFNEGRTGAGLEPLRIGIGLNTGELMLGIVGGENRMEGTVISDAVNVASRMEDLNKMYGTSVLISEQTADSLLRPGDFNIRKLDRVRVKGKTMPIGIYEVFDADPEQSRSAKLATLEQFERAVALFHEGEAAEAEALFARIADRNPRDQAALLYVERCRRNQSGPSGPTKEEEAL
jgi:class 3 adenylate cyclase